MTAPAATVSRGKATNGKAPPVDVATPEYGRTVLDIPVDAIEIGENVRKSIDEASIDELAATIAQVGILQPIKVVQTERNGGLGKYLLVYGQRRLLAARKAGVATIPAIVDYQRLEQERESFAFEQLVENLIRADLNPIDEAKALRAILDADPKLTQTALAKRLGRSDPWLSNALRLLELAPGVQAKMAAGEISQSHGKAIAAVDVDLQEQFAARVVENGWSAHDAERQASWFKQEVARTREREERAVKHLSEALELLGKVATREKAKIAVAGYYDGGSLAKLLEADGWTIVANGYDVRAIDQAGSCGCKGVWRLDVPYNATTRLKLMPACSSQKHQVAREKERQAKWQAEHAEARAKRAADEAAAEGRRERVAAVLADGLAAPLGQRLLLMALVSETDIDPQLIDRYWDGDLDALHEEPDVNWAVVQKIPDKDLIGIVARVAADALLAWPSETLTAAVDELLAPEPAEASA